MKPLLVSLVASVALTLAASSHADDAPSATSPSSAADGHASTGSAADAAAPPTPEPSAIPPPLLLPPRPPAPVRTVWIHVNSRHPVMLELLTPDETRWQRICEAPCDGEVPLDGVYRVSGHGLAPSRILELEANPGDRVALEVSPRTNAEHRTGDRLVITSYIAGAVGLGLEIGALAVDPSSPAQPALLWTGVGAAAVAIACTISGYVLLQPTGLSQSEATPGRAAMSAPLTKLAVWRDLDPGSRWMPRATSFPVLTTAF